MLITTPEDKQVTGEFLKKCTDNIWTEEYRPWISELEKNEVICKLWDKEIHLKDFLHGSEELRANVLKEMQKKVETLKQTKEDLNKTLQK